MYGVANYFEKISYVKNKQVTIRKLDVSGRKGFMHLFSMNIWDHDDFISIEPVVYKCDTGILSLMVL